MLSGTSSPKMPSRMATQYPQPHTAAQARKPTTRSKPTIERPIRFISASRTTKIPSVKPTIVCSNTTPLRRQPHAITIGAIQWSKPETRARQVATSHQPTRATSLTVGDRGSGRLDGLLERRNLRLPLFLPLTQPAPPTSPTSPITTVTSDDTQGKGFLVSYRLGATGSWQDISQ